MTPPEDDQPAIGDQRLERLLAELAAGFITLPADAIDAHIERAVGLVAEFAGADRLTVGQPSGGTFARTHQWVRPGFARVPEDDPVNPYPWLGPRVFGDRRTVLISRLAELPPEAARDRQSLERLGVRSLAVFPLVAGDALVGVLSFATLARERDWPAGLIDGLRLAGDLIGSALARKGVQAQLDRTLAFERLLAEISALFVGAPSAAVDDHITAALGRVANFLDVDVSHVGQMTGDSRGLQVTHQWVRDEAWRVPPFVPAEVVPWVTERMQGGHPVVFSRLDDLPPEAARDRDFIERIRVRSGVILPLAVGGVVRGALALGAIGRERAWPAEVIDRLRLVAEIVAAALERKQADLELRAALTDNERLRRRLEAENVYLQAEAQGARNFDEIVGRSPAIRAMLHKVDQVAATDAPVLLLGETGTGKELVAHAIHARSGRQGRPLIVVNCAALPPTLIESELFGHEKGAFTGALQARPGRFELADGSTLFLDEIGDLDPALQSRLLRALQGGEIQRLGSTRTLKVNARIIAATNRDLDAARREGRFRDDLYYRLGVFPIAVPPLRERREDIPLLVWHFIETRQRALGRRITEITPEEMQALLDYDWPGNVRELQNVIERALILSVAPTLRLREAFGAPGVRTPASKPRHAAGTLREAEQAHIVDALERSGWTIEGRGQAAERLGLRPSTLRNRMRKLGIRRPAGPAQAR